MEKKLYRSQNNRMLAGVCGGLGEYLNLDPTVIRVVWALISLLGGTGVLLYLICIFIIPENPLYY